MAEIGGVQERKLLRAERLHRLAALDDRLHQVRRVPLRGDDVEAFGSQPCLEQLPLGRLAGAVGAFESDKKSAAARGVRESGPRELPQAAVVETRRHGFDKLKPFDKS